MMTSPSLPFETNPPATESEIASLLALNIPLPADYLDFLRRSNGGGTDDFQIHSVADVVNYHRGDDYGLASLGLAYFATDGGGTAYCFRKRGKGSGIIALSLESPDEQSAWESHGTKFNAFVRAIRGEQDEAAAPTAVTTVGATLRPVPVRLLGPLISNTDYFAAAADVIHFIAAGSGSPDDRQEVRRISAATLKELPPIRFSYRTMSRTIYGVLAVSADGTRLAAPLDPGLQRNDPPHHVFSHTLIAHDIRTNRRIALWRAETEALDKFSSAFDIMAFTPDGTKILSNELDQSIRLYDIASGKVEGLGRHTKPVTSLAVSPDGRWAVTAGRDKKLRLWDLKKRAEVERFPVQKYVPIYVSWSPDGTRIFVVHEVERSSAIVEFSTGKIVCQLKGKNNSRIRNGVFTADSRRLVTAGSENTVDLRDAATGNLLAQAKFEGFIVYSFRVGALKITPDGRHILYAPYTNEKPILCWALPN